MKTLADFKRDAASGKIKLEMVERSSIIITTEKSLIIRLEEMQF